MDAAYVMDQSTFDRETGTVTTQYANADDFLTAWKMSWDQRTRTMCQLIARHWRRLLALPFCWGRFMFRTPPVCRTLLGATICVLGRCKWRTRSTQSFDSTRRPKSRCSTVFGGHGWGPSNMFWTPYNEQYMAAQSFPDGFVIVRRR